MAGRRDTWCDESVEILKTMWLDPNITAVNIGKRLGYSRDAVARKAKRLGLKSKKNTFWNGERVAILKKLWPQADVSAAMIGARLGVSRKAIIGKAHRLKLRGKETHRTKYKQKELKIVTPLAKVSKRDSALYHVPKVPERINPNKCIATIDSRRPRVPPVFTAGKPFHEIDSGHCQFAITSHKAKKHLFCGLETNGNKKYCKAHLAFLKLGKPIVKPRKAANHTRDASISYFKKSRASAYQR